jgi:hypothetical protein
LIIPNFISAVALVLLIVALALIQNTAARWVLAVLALLQVVMIAGNLLTHGWTQPCSPFWRGVLSLGFNAANGD